MTAAEVTTDVRVLVLGPLRAEVGGSPAELGGRLRRAVLARLAVAGGEVVPADRLADDLWPGEAAPRALAALQVHLSHLRRALEPSRAPRTPASVLVSAPPGYALRVPAGLDSKRFTAALAAADALEPAAADTAIGEALALWTGPAFAEFADEPWARAEAARLEELRLVAVERRARARLDRGRAAAAVVDLEPHVAQHPLRESAVGLLALALYRDGRQADALAVLSRTRRRLVEELGVDPGPALRALERDVLAHAVPLPPPADRTAAGPRTADLDGRDADADDRAAGRLADRPGGTARPAGSPPDLVGRDAELRRLRAAAEQVHAGSALQVVLVAADAGGGKTALVDALRADLDAHGWTTAAGRCPEVDGAPPGWAWREITDALTARRPAAGDLAARLAPLRAPAGPGETFWVARAVADLLRHAAPVLLVLDDLHRADGETLQILRAAVAGAGAAPVLVVGTLRPGEAGADLTAALAALAGSITDRVVLPGLGADGVRQLLARHGAGAADPGTVALVGDRTGGNPLFVRETARLLAAGGDAHAVPDGVRDVLRQRVARLPAPARTVLRYAALLGREVDVDTLLAVVPDPDAALDALELGVVDGLLDEPATGRVRFTHVLVRDALSADVPRLRRARVHAAALTALEGAGGADAAALAHHALAAGPGVAPGRALPLVTAAATTAARGGAWRDAARLWAAGLDLAAAAGADRAAEVALRCAHVSALAHAGDAAGAVAARTAAVAAARDTDRLYDALTSFDAPTSWSLRQLGIVDTDRVALIEDLLARTTDPGRRVRLLVTLVLETESGDDERARSASAEAMALSAGLDPASRCAALNARGFVVNGPDLPAERGPVGRELLAVAGPAGLDGYRTVGHHLLFMDATGRLDLDEAQAHADAAVAIAPAGQLGFTLAWSAIYGALRALVTGDAERAEAEYAAVQRQQAAAGGINTDLMALAGLLAVRHAQGRHGELAEQVLPLAVHETLAEVAAAVLTAAGRRDEAARVWRPDVEPVRTYFWQLMTVLRAETAIALGHREVAAACHAALLPWAGTLAGASSGSTTLGPVDTTLAELAAFLGRPAAEVAAHRAAAVALARSLGATYWERRAAG